MSKLDPIEIDPKEFFHHHFTLPALPEVVSKIQELIHSDSAGIGKVANLVSGEPALVAQILKVVNSAYYGLPREVTEVKMAVAFLGLNEIYRMVLSLSVVNTLGIDEKDELNRFWFHSFFTALCTKYLAKKFSSHLSTEELWSAAILHDIGKLIYLKFFTAHYQTLMRFCREEGCLFSEAERHFSLPPSAYLGSLLCDYWRLPNHIKIACEYHSLSNLPNIDTKSSSEHFRLIICLGNLLSVLSADELSEATKQKIASSTKTVLKLTDPEFLTMMGDIYDLRSEVERFMEQLR
jgi:HD-like signal output (HDOD) protein